MNKAQAKTWALFLFQDAQMCFDGMNHRSDCLVARGWQFDHVKFCGLLCQRKIHSAQSSSRCLYFTIQLGEGFILLS